MAKHPCRALLPASPRAGGRTRRPGLPALVLLVLSALLIGACAEPARAPAQPAAAARPADAVRVLTRHLRDDDLEAFARDAVPPALHARLEQAWRNGETRWPLAELPFDERLPALLGVLAAPGSEARLQRDFDRQFARAEAELKAAASSLGLFAVHYIGSGGDFSAAERDHYAQLVAAGRAWAMAAPLSDPRRARAAIAQLAAAARRSGLSSEADFARLGMAGSLRRLSPVQAATKRVLARYGLDLDASLSAMDATLHEQTGDRARVRMRYTLAGTPIDTVVAVERHDGRWYVSDFLRHAEAAVAAGPPLAAAPAP